MFKIVLFAAEDIAALHNAICRLRGRETFCPTERSKLRGGLETSFRDMPIRARLASTITLHSRMLLREGHKIVLSCPN